MPKMPSIEPRYWKKESENRRMRKQEAKIRERGKSGDENKAKSREQKR